jgi:hypothetical protein
MIRKPPYVGVSAEMWFAKYLAILEKLPSLDQEGRKPIVRSVVKIPYFGVAGHWKRMFSSDSRYLAASGHEIDDPCMGTVRPLLMGLGGVAIHEHTGFSLVRPRGR